MTRRSGEQQHTVSGSSPRRGASSSPCPPADRLAVPCPSLRPDLTCPPASRQQHVDHMQGCNCRI